MIRRFRLLLLGFRGQLDRSVEAGCELQSEFFGPNLQLLGAGRAELALRAAEAFRDVHPVGEWSVPLVTAEAFAAERAVDPEVAERVGVQVMCPSHD